MRRRFSRLLAGYQPEELFALVADIEAYPDFIPFCREARVIRRDGEVLRVVNVFGLGPLRLRFTSEAVLAAPRALTISSQDALWRRFEMRWRFDPEAGGCRLSCDMALEFSSAMLEALSPLAGPELETQVMQAFERRAKKLFGERL
jgi:coenzyme Q-binding protein COQ10